MRKFHEIPSSRLGRVTDTNCVLPFLYKLLSPCYAIGDPKIQSDQNYKIGGAQLQYHTRFP